MDSAEPTDDFRNERPGVDTLKYATYMLSVKIKVSIDEHIIIVRSVAVIYAWIK